MPCNHVALAIKTALKDAEGCMLSRRKLRENLEPELAQCGDKASRKEAFSTALENLMHKGKVTLEGSMVTFSKKRTRDEAEAGAEPKAEVDDAAKDESKKAKKAKTSDDAAQSEAAVEYRKSHKIEVVGTCQAVLPEPFLTFDAAAKHFGEKIVGQLQADYKEPSPIQAQSWPVALAGKDMVAVAKTGSGKTLAFLLPSLCVAVQERQANSKSQGPCVVVLAPTRELATQIEEVAVRFAGIVGVPSACVYGGVPKGPQAKALKSVSNGLVIATPGRLVDHLHDKSVDLKSARVTVLDEADRMLDMGFQPQLAEIFAALPAAGERQLLLFTATWPKAVKKMAASYLAFEGSVHLSIGSTDEKGPTANTSVSQEFYQLNDLEKDDELLRVLFKMPDSAKVLMFTNTKRRADNLAKLLWTNGYGCSAVHGDKPQQEREKALAAFRAGEYSVLVATDVASRGLDINGVTHVVNFDMPRDVEGYIHRIGRTGRAGNTGTSVTFWNADYDTECAPALAKIARDAGQPVPPWLEKAADKMGQGKKLWAISKIAECKVDA